MLLCIAPSPDDKRIYVVPHHDSGSVLRASEVQRHVSGKGVNAARAASTGGNEVTLAAFAGAEFEHRLRVAFGDGPVHPLLVPTRAHTRSCVTVVPGDGGPVLEIVEEAPPVEPDEAARFVETVMSAIRSASALVLAGSLPPGLRVEDSARIVAAGRAAAVPTVVDAHGDHLRALLAARPYCVRINRDELNATVPRDAAPERDTAAQAHWLQNEGAEHVVISDGDAPVLLFGPGEGSPRTLLVPRIRAVNAVGSGDAMSGGIGVMLAGGAAIEDAVLYGTALGMANAGSLLPGVCDRETTVLHAASLRWDRM
jgi:tagatose 6-phosphate kinase